MSGKILIIEDDNDIVELISLHLSELAYEVDSAGDGEEGLRKALSGDHDLVILDWKLPKLEGLEVCRRIRVQDTLLPVLMLTSRSSEIDKILGLEIGADDYLTKPFSPRELVARVKALLRRKHSTATASTSPSDVITASNLSLNTATRQVFWDGKELALTALEFDLLCFLMQNPEIVLTREQLLNKVWGYNSDGYDRVVTSYMSRLRQKIEAIAGNASIIRTVQGIGYKFSIPDESDNSDAEE